jgi:hypothetical protein
MPEFDITQAPPSYFDGQIESLEKQLEEQLASAERTRSRLQWFKDGRYLFGETASANGEEQEIAELDLFELPAGSIELLPPRDAMHKPSLRQAILYAMLERVPVDGHEAEWAAKAVIAHLTENGDMPSGNHAENTVRNMLRDMTGRGQLERPNYGTYRLPPRLRVTRQIDPGPGP